MQRCWTVLCWPLSVVLRDAMWTYRANIALANLPALRSRNAAALTDGNWWRGTLTPRPAVNWYLNKVDAAMQGLKRKVDGAPITVLTHSVRPLFLEQRRKSLHSIVTTHAWQLQQKH